MKKVFETGHAKNVANFDDLVSICDSYGPSYNPSKASLRIPSLQNLLNMSKFALDDVTIKLTDFEDATNVRQNLFARLKKLSTRIVSALKVTDAPDNKIDNAISVNRKIQGGRAPKKKKSPPTPPLTSPKNRIPFLCPASPTTCSSPTSRASLPS